MMLMVRMVVMVLVRMVVANEEKEDLKIKNPIYECDDDTDGDDGNDDDTNEDTFSWCSPGRRSPRGGRWERGQPSTWTSFCKMLMVVGKMCFLSFPLSLLSFVSNLHFLPLSLTNCLPSLPSFQFIGGSNTDARLFANGIVLL